RPAAVVVRYFGFAFARGVFCTLMSSRMPEMPARQTFSNASFVDVTATTGITLAPASRRNIITTTGFPLSVVSAEPEVKLTSPLLAWASLEGAGTTAAPISVRTVFHDGAYSPAKLWATASWLFRIDTRQAVPPAAPFT